MAQPTHQILFPADFLDVFFFSDHNQDVAVLDPKVRTGGNQRAGSQVLTKRNNDHVVRLDADGFDDLFVPAIGKNSLYSLKPIRIPVDPPILHEIL